MIAALKGVLAEKSASDAIVDVGGVGYRVSLSLLAMAKLPELGASVSLRVRTVVREDAFDLYGFLSRTEEELFLLLTSVSHVGPKMALTVLSGLEVDDLVGCIAKGDVARLTKVHGVGKKTAERLVLELKDKMKVLAVGSPAPGTAPASGSAPGRGDLISALINLGYKPPQAEHAAQVVGERVAAESPFDVQFREALKVLRAGQ